MTEHGTPVVIVGAGPCGLAAACGLLMRGVPVRVLEASARPARGSRALQLWPPALEVLHAVGVLDEAEQRGMRVRGTAYHLGGRRLSVELGMPNEPLLLPQEHTARLLENKLEALGGRVERSTAVTGLSQTEDTVTVALDGPGGPERVETPWLIGADGVRSTVRDRLGISFPGGQVPVNFILAEGEVEGHYRPGVVHYFLGRAGSVVFGPMRDGRVRISAAVAEGTAATAEAIQELLDERTGGRFRVVRLDHVGMFTSAERIASSFRRGRCFLIGDAAHTHSPIGGQGLSLGLQDAHNLTWKLAGVEDGAFAPSILDSYGPERRQAADHVIRATQVMIRMFTLPPAAAALRNLSWRALESTGMLRRCFVPLLAGWWTRYRDVLPGAPADQRAGLRPHALPRTGSRIPPWIPAPRAGTVPGFRLFTLGQRTEAPLVRHGRALAERMPDLMTHHHLHSDELEVRASGFLLIRPDGYVAANGTRPVELAAAGRRLMSLVAAS